MIAKISTGSNVLGMVKYNHNKISKIIDGGPEAQFLFTNNITDNSFKGIVNSIQNYNQRNLRVQKPNIHISLNFHKDDILTNEKLKDITNYYMKKLGYEDQPFAVYRHYDRDHPHVHIVSTQISIEGKKINDSHLKYRSMSISRSIEDKYQITKAVNHSDVLKNNIETQINNYLEKGRGAVLPILRSAINEVLNKKPVSLKEFDLMLNQYNIKRTQSNSEDKHGHFFHILNIEELNEPNQYVKHKGVRGSEIDKDFSFPALKNTIENFNKMKSHNLKNVMGRTYSIINAMEDQVNLSDFKIELQKKGIILEVKRRQSGTEIGKIFGFKFKDSKTGVQYSATDLKIKSIELASKLHDDTLSSVINKQPAVEISDTSIKYFQPLESNAGSLVKNIHSLIELFENHTQTQEDETLLKEKKKRKRRRE